MLGGVRQQWKRSGEVTVLHREVSRFPSPLPCSAGGGLHVQAARPCLRVSVCSRCRVKPGSSGNRYTPYLPDHGGVYWDLMWSTDHVVIWLLLDLLEKQNQHDSVWVMPCKSQTAHEIRGEKQFKLLCLCIFCVLETVKSLSCSDGRLAYLQREMAGDLAKV